MPSSDRFDLEQIAMALQDQVDSDFCHLIDPRTGEWGVWTSDGGIDGENPVDLDELDLIPIAPLPPSVWYQDMADFAEGLTDEQAGRRLARAIRGKGAFRRFRDELHEEYPELVAVWNDFSQTRARHRAVEWLADNTLIDRAATDRYVAENPDPALP